MVACSSGAPPALTQADVDAALGVLEAACRRVPADAPPALVAVCAAIPPAEARPAPPLPPQSFGGYTPQAATGGSGGAES